MHRDEITFTVEKATDGGYIAGAVGRPIFSQAETLEDLRLNVADAVRCHFDPGEEPAVIRFRQIG